MDNYVHKVDNFLFHVKQQNCWNNFWTSKNTFSFFQLKPWPQKPWKTQTLFHVKQKTQKKETDQENLTSENQQFPKRKRIRTFPKMQLLLTSIEIPFRNRKTRTATYHQFQKTVSRETNLQLLVIHILCTMWITFKLSG